MSPLKNKKSANFTSSFTIHPQTYLETQDAAVRTNLAEISTPVQKLWPDVPWFISIPAAQGMSVGLATVPPDIREDRTSSSLSGANPNLARNRSVSRSVRTVLQSMDCGSTSGLWTAKATERHNDKMARACIVFRRSTEEGQMLAFLLCHFFFGRRLI